MTILTPIAIVIDRATAAKRTANVRLSLKELGGAWHEMFIVWERTAMPYLVLLAHTPERLRQRAPLTMMVANDDALRTTIQHCCGEMVGLKCKWLLLMQKDSVGRETTESELLLDFAAGGTA